MYFNVTINWILIDLYFEKLEPWQNVGIPYELPPFLSYPLTLYY